MNSYFEITSAVADFYLETSLRAFSLAGEQGDRIARMALDNSKLVREEGLRFAQRWAELARDNNRQLTATFNNAVKVGVDNYRNASQQTLDELTQQAGRLNKQAAPAASGKAAKG